MNIRSPIRLHGEEEAKEPFRLYASPLWIAGAIIIAAFITRGKT